MEITIAHISPCDECGLEQARRVYDIIKDTVCFDMSYEDFERNFISNTALRILTAKRGNKIIGVALYFFHDYLECKDFFIQWFAVDKEHQRQVIGKRMLNALKKCCIGNAVIRFHVFAENTGARKFYKSVGAFQISDDFLEMALR
jgi:ribosomal protein S18 acetylase RimI-like enzyme